MVEIDNLLVDLDALLRVEHVCDPLRCRDRRTCCGCYEVCLGAREISRMVGVLPQAAHYKPDLLDEEYANAFDEVERNLYALDTDTDDICVFAYRGPEGQVLCSIHSAALELGVKPERVKPVSCLLWPLSLSEGKPKILSVQEDAFDFPCTRRRAAAGDDLDPQIASILGQVFGSGLLRKVREALEARAARG